MASMLFKAVAYVTMRIEADDESHARSIIVSNLDDADTDFIRTDHWPKSGFVAEFRLSEIENQTPLPQPDQQGDA